MRTTSFIAAATATAFVVALGFLAADRGEGSGPAGPPLPAGLRAGAAGAAGDARAGARATTDARIAALSARLRTRAADADGYALLAAAFLQKVRETGDPGYYARADRALARAFELEPASAAAFTQRGSLRLSRHDFAGALRDGRRAHALAPVAIEPYRVLVDANVELGRLGTAARTLQRMIDLKPDLAAYARVSYLRELHGDLAGARRAIELAVAAGGATPENTAYVQTLLGDLELGRGHRRAAACAYRAGLRGFPGYVRAQAGLARVSAAAGDLPRAIAALRGVVQRLPLPEYSVALGEAELAAGRAGAARRDLALVRAQERLLRGAGVNTDAEVALFEAQYGDRARAVALGRAAWRSAPSARSADALGWALTHAGRPAAGLIWGMRALAPGGRDAMQLYHAGMSARAAGRADLARTLLRRAL
ncbi:MAG: hypothetical protein QOJ89_5026, partial [bacterium]